MIISRKMHHKRNPSDPMKIIFLFCLPALLLFSGCSLMVSSATSGMMEHLSRTILDNDDLALVESGAPAYLLMIDSLISKDPENEGMLSNAALLYSAYADVFVKDKKRSRKMADKALDYALRAICLTRTDACNIKKMPYKDFEAVISDMDKDDVPVLFALGNAWTGWIIANKNDFNAIADISRIEKIMQQVVLLDKTYKDGAAYLYLGSMATLLPPALGGKPEQGRQYFDAALEISKGRNLMVKVMYAKLYARMIFDRSLHDRLLKEVLEADPDIPGHTLVNTYAQKQAEELLAGADDYF